MITTKEIIRILRNNEVSEDEQDRLELILQERAEELLEKFSKGKAVVIRAVVGVDELIDCIDLAERMKEADTDDVAKLIPDAIEHQVNELLYGARLVEYNVENNN